MTASFGCIRQDRTKGPPLAPAGHPQDAAGRVGGGIGEQEHDGLGDLVCRAGALHRNHRCDARDAAGTANPLAGADGRIGMRRLYMTGASQTAGFLRDFIYLGFNEDEAHRQVFDAVMIYVPGSHRLFANVEFADPNTYSRQDDRHDFLSTSYPPFTYAVTTDPISGIRDGILKRPATDPLVIHIDGEAEIWQFKASLNTTNGLGEPVPIQRYLPSNGGSDESVFLFCGRVDSTAAGGVHGLAEEHEDIRVVVKTLAEIEALLDQGAIESGHTLIGLYWLLRHRDHLRQLWTVD